MPEPTMGPMATMPRIGKRMMRAASSPAPPLRRKALRKMHQRSLARAANWARLWAVVQVAGGWLELEVDSR